MCDWLESISLSDAIGLFPVPANAPELMYKGFNSFIPSVGYTENSRSCFPTIHHMGEKTQTIYILLAYTLSRVLRLDYCPGQRA